MWNFFYVALAATFAIIGVLSGLVTVGKFFVRLWTGTDDSDAPNRAGWALFTLILGAVVYHKMGRHSHLSQVMVVIAYMASIKYALDFLGDQRKLGYSWIMCLWLMLADIIWL